MWLLPPVQWHLPVPSSPRPLLSCQQVFHRAAMWPQRSANKALVCGAAGRGLFQLSHSSGAG